VQDQRMRVFYLCNSAQAQNIVLEALQGYDQLSFDLALIDPQSDFRITSLQDGFDAGLVDLDALPQNEDERSQVLEGLGKRVPLVMLISSNEEKQAFHFLTAGLIRDYIILSNVGVRKLPFALRSAALWGDEAMKKNIIKSMQADEGLISDEASLYSLFQNSMVGLARTTPEGHILLANPALIQMLGFDSLEEMQDRDLEHEGFTSDQPREEFCKLVEAQGELHSYESTWVRKDGALIHVRESARAVRGEDNKVLYYESVIEDITEQKQASSALKEKIAALQALTGIDRDILAASQAGDILQVVCRSAASLLKTAMAIIISTHEGRWSVDATFGIKYPEKMAEELNETFPRDATVAPAGYSINEVSVSPRMMPKTIALEGMRAMLVETLLVGTVKQGILFVIDTRPRAWTENDRDLLKTLAGQAAIALEKVRLLTDAERRADEFAALYEISTSLSGERELQLILSLITDSICQTMDVSNAFIYLYNEKNDTLRLTISKGMELSTGLIVKMGEGMAGRVAATRKPLLIDKYRKGDNRILTQDVAPFSSVLEVPMLFSGILIGVLGLAEIDNESRIFSEQEEHLLSLFAAQAASVVYKTNLIDSIQTTNQMLDRLSRASNALIDSVSDNLTELSQKITQIVVSEFQQANCSLWLLSGDSPSIQRMAIAGEESTEFILMPLKLDGTGLIPKAIHERKIINVPDVLVEPDYLAGWSSACSELVLPLKNGEEVIGVLDLQSDKASAFLEDDIRILEQFASRASLMLEHAQLVAETQQGLLRLSALHTVDIAVASSLDLQVTLNVFLEQVSSQLSVDATDILLLNPHLQVLEYAAGRGFRGTGIRRVSLRVGEDAAGKAALERMVVGISGIDSTDAQISHPERIAGEGFDSVYAVPLIARGKMKGVLELYFRNRFKADIEWQNFVETLAHQAAIAIDDAHLFEQLQLSLTDLAVAYNSTIQGWARLLELRKVEPEGHSRAVSAMSVELAGSLKVPEQELIHIYRGALLHDIGKLAIPDHILLKPGNLNENEKAIIHTHPVIARDLLVTIDYLRSAAVIPYAHHEKWDGSGYPVGLAGTQIPLPARIFSVVDVWDTLMRSQPYRTAWSEPEATNFIRSGAGRDFDPIVVEAFLNLISDGRNRAIAEKNEML
jgi:PAS domain S-box-containing protein